MNGCVFTSLFIERRLTAALSSSSTSIVSASRRSRTECGSAMCVEPSKKMPSALRGEAESASVVARVQARKPPTTLDMSCRARGISPVCMVAPCLIIYCNRPLFVVTCFPAQRRRLGRLWDRLASCTRISWIFESSCVGWPACERGQRSSWGVPSSVSSVTCSAMDDVQRTMHSF